MKKFLCTFACASLLFAGCAASEQPVTVDNAPNDLMKDLAALNSESEGSTVLDALEKVIQKTAEADDYGIWMEQNIDAANVSTADGTLEAIENKNHVIDVRVANDNSVLELLQQEQDGSPVVGLMRADNKNVTTVFGTYSSGGVGVKNSKINIESVDTQEQPTSYTDEELKDVVNNTVVYPLYSFIGSSLILQPFASPEYYDFALTKTGDNYTLKISMKDQEKYNEYLDKFVKDSYGYERVDLQGDGSLIADEYVTDTVDIILTMDEEGVLSRIENNTSSTITQNETSIDAYSRQAVDLKKADEATITFLKEFFEKLDAGDYKQGSSFDLPV